MPQKKHKAFKIAVRIFKKKPEEVVTPVAPTVLPVKKVPVANVTSVQPSAHVVAPKTVALVPTVPKKQPHRIDSRWDALPVSKKKPQKSKKLFSFSSLWLWGVAHRRLLVVLIIFAGFSAIAGAVLFEKYTFPVASARVVPNSTFAFASLNVSPWDSQVGEALSLLNTRSDAAQSRIDTQKQALQFFNIPQEAFTRVSEREVALAVLPSQTSGVAEALIFGYGSSKKADTFLAAVVDGAEWKMSDYKGQKIFTRITGQGSAAEKSGASFVVLPHWIIATSDTTSAFLFIDVAARDLPALSTVSDYKTERARVGANILAFGYVNSQKLSLLSDVFKKFVPSQAMAFLPDDRLFGGALFVKNHALEFQLNMTGGSNSSAEGATHITSLLPRSTIFSLEGVDFAKQFRSFEDALKAQNPLYAFYINTVTKQLADAFQLNVDADLLPFLTSNYAVAFDTASSRLKTTGKPFQNVTAFLTISDPAGFAAHESALQTSVAKILASQFQAKDVKFQDMQYAGLTLHTVVHPDIPVDLYYTVYNNMLVISSAKDVFGFLGGQTLPALGSSATISSQLKQLSGGAQRYYYLNFAQLAQAFPELGLAQNADSVVLRESRNNHLVQFTGILSLQP